MPVSKTRHKDRPAKKKSVNPSRFAQTQERKRSERAMQVGFTNKWAFLWWTLPALGFGFGVNAVYSAINGMVPEGSSSLRVLVAFFCISVVTAVPTYLFVLGVARSAFTMRPIMETIKRFSFKGAWLESLLLSLITPVILSAILSVSFPNPSDMIQWSWLVLIAATFFPISNALKFAYREQYREVTLSEPELKALEDEKVAFKSLSLREKIKRRMSVKSFVGPHGKLLMPNLQAVIVWLLPSILISVGVITFAPSNEVSGDQYGSVSQALAPFSFLVLMLTVTVWSKWHLVGGIGRISRLTEGRPLEPIY